MKNDFSAHETAVSTRAFIIVTLIFFALACAIARAQTVEPWRGNDVLLREDFEASVHRAAVGAVTGESYAFPLAAYLVDTYVADRFDGTAWAGWFAASHRSGRFGARDSFEHSRFAPAVSGIDTVTYPQSDVPLPSNLGSYAAGGFSMTPKEMQSSGSELAPTLVEVPEPSTWAAAVLALAAVAATQRRRFRRARAINRSRLRYNFFGMQRLGARRLLALTFAIAGAASAALAGKDKSACPISIGDVGQSANVVSPERANNKVLVNHNTGNGSVVVICVSQRAAQAHLAEHRDTGGTTPCTHGGPQS